MKLIIDIPDEMYDCIKKDTESEMYIIDVIKKGIPYEPKGDLISRSDALKAVDSRHEELLHDTIYSSKDCQIDLLGIKKHILAIPPVDAIVNTIEVRPQGGWIPVSERLPEENGEYLVTKEAYIDRENRNMAIIIDIASFTINHELNNGFHKANTVIAWKPLPEPYKEEGKE